MKGFGLVSREGLNSKRTVAATVVVIPGPMWSNLQRILVKPMYIVRIKNYLIRKDFPSRKRGDGLCEGHSKIRSRIN